MEKFKIENFESENDNDVFPVFRPLSTRENETVRQNLCRSFGLQLKADGVVLVSEIAKLQKKAGEMNAAQEGFNLTACINSLGVATNDDVLVNWYRFDDIDEFNLADLSEHFDDIWYPSSDDIDIFDSSFTWVLTVDHDGVVLFITI